MRRIPIFLLAVILASGCTDNTAPPAATGTTTSATTGVTPLNAEEEAEIRAELNKLSPEDRAVAEKQKFCAIQTNTRLGEMGVPTKLMLKGQPVFFCCGGCEKSAKKNPDKTLETVADLKAKNAPK